MVERERRSEGRREGEGGRWRGGKTGERKVAREMNNARRRVCEHVSSY